MGYGTYFRAYSLARHVVEAGHEVTLVCSEGKSGGYRPTNPPGLNVVTSPVLRPQRDYGGELVRAVFNASKSLSERYDIIHGFTASQPSVWLPSLVGLVQAKTLVVDWDDLWGGGFSNAFNGPASFMLKSLEGSLPRIADGVTVASSFLYGHAVRMGIDNRKIEQIPNGANVTEIVPLDRAAARRALGIPLESEVVASVGQRLWYGSTRLLLRMLTELRKTHKGVKLLLAGELFMDGDTMELCKEAEENVILLGKVPYESLPQVLGASDVLVLPMDNTPVDRARFPIRLGDYMSAGRPIVSNAVGEVKTIIEGEHCGLTCGVDDLGLLPELVSELLSSRTLAIELGANARNAAVRKYSWSAIASQLLRFYSRVG